MNEETPYVIVTTTVDSQEAAHRITEALLIPRLVACVQASSIQSTFWWKDALERTNEIRLQAKAPQDNISAIMAAIEAHHPYEVPEIIVTPILDGNPSYLNWIGDETQSAEERPDMDPDA
jgi:periplasmic divalent cation tolerance protein